MRILLLLLLIINSAYSSENKWSFRFFNSFSSKDTLNKNVLDDLHNSNELENLVHNIATVPESHSDRLDYIAKSCEGLSLREKVEMAKHLGGLTSDIYDYDKIENRDKISSPEQQWNAIKTLVNSGEASEKSGVCRDMTFTVSEFLLQCGVPKQCLSIQGFNTDSGGHQVVQVSCEDEVYTINWSELYVTDNKEVINADLVPRIENAAIRVRHYDPETHEIITNQHTELGQILATIAKAEVDDPLYNPQLLMLEAQYSVLTLGAFKAKLTRGDELSGFKAFLENQPFKWLHLKGGIVISKNDISQSSIEKYQQLSQDIAYFHTDTRIKAPTFELLNMDAGKIIIDNEIYTSSEYAYMVNTLSGVESKNHEGYLFFGYNSQVMFASEAYNIYLKIKNKHGFHPVSYGTEIADQPNLGRDATTYLHSRSIEAGFQTNYKDHNFSASLKKNQIYYGDIHSIKVGYQYQDDFSVGLNYSELKEYWLEETRKDVHLDIKKNFNSPSFGNINLTLSSGYQELFKQYNSGINFEYIPN